MVMDSVPHLQGAFLGAGVQLEVVDADGRDDVSFTPGVTGTVRENDLVVALAASQQTQVLRERWGRGHVKTAVPQLL